MALSTDVQYGSLGGRVSNLVTKATIPVRVVIYPDFDELTDLPGGADESGDLLVGGDKTVPLVTIADTSVINNTSMTLWGYVTDGTGKYVITVIGDSSQIGQPQFSYRMVVTSVDGTITYSDHHANVPAGTTVWLASLPVKTTASEGTNRTTVNVIGTIGGNAPATTVGDLTDVTEYFKSLAVVASSPADMLSRLGGTSLTEDTANPGLYLIGA